MSINFSEIRVVGWQLTTIADKNTHAQSVHQQFIEERTGTFVVPSADIRLPNTATN